MQFFIDFDGTISKNDAVDLILERFASGEWKKVEQEWVAGKIGSRECLTRQMALVSASQKELTHLISQIEVDPHFVSFLKTAKDLNIPVTIVSDGFRFVIEGILNRILNNSEGLVNSLPIFSNELEWHGGRIQVLFPKGSVCEHGCANCKARVIDAQRKPKQRIIFIGDGLSDRFAAMASDLTFAKHKLLKFCEENSITHKRYSSFKEIENYIIFEHSLSSQGA
ncbi:MAG: hypothetical protein AUJ72_05200 [Candidatus Omnitrophica bacterium CG1_02_46_14]|nr:MAG: hypothetical protein AUJ72_05200 [Candidatus Omnitrophica bacterium CG1_02_46_14]